MNRHYFRPVLDRMECRTLLALTLAPIPTQFLSEGSTLAVQVQATPDPGLTVVYALPAAPPGMTINAAGLILWMPPNVKQVVDVTVSANECSDPVMAVTESFQVYVFDVAPSVNVGLNGTAVTNTLFVRGGSFTDHLPESFSAVATYGDGTPQDPVTLNADKTFSLAHAYTSPGIYNVQVTVYDSEGSQGNGIFSVVVTTSAVPVTTPPVSAGAPVLGVDYAFAAYRWPSNHLTWSIVPDGTITANGGPPSNLQATFNAEMGPGVWEQQFAHVFQVWAAAANLTITEVSDSGAPIGSPGAIQANQHFGDIRISGYGFASGSQLLAQTFYPDPVSTVGGDETYDTNYQFSVGGASGTYDLFSVALHESGLAIGLAEVSNSIEVMSGVYHGVLTGLAPGDAYAIEQLYGPSLPPAAMAAEPTMLTPRERRLIATQQAHDEAIVRAARRQERLELETLRRIERRHVVQMEKRPIGFLS